MNNHKNKIEDVFTIIWNHKVSSARPELKEYQTGNWRKPNFNYSGDVYQKKERTTKKPHNHKRLSEAVF